ncbi:hypothetical protein Drorol1_Dr00017870 [Drosera rotundifolia]
MIVMMEELLRIRRKAEEPVEADIEKYFQRLNAYRTKRFIGDDDLMILENWFGDMEKLYKAIGCLEKLKVSFGVYYLEGEANNWWTTVMERAELPNFDREQLKELICDSSEAEKKRKFVKGFSWRLKTSLLTYKFVSYQQMYDKAVNLERFLAEKDAFFVEKKIQMMQDLANLVDFNNLADLDLTNEAGRQVVLLVWDKEEKIWGHNHTIHNMDNNQT